MERKGGTVVNAGPVEFLLRYRDEIMDDQGLCLQVYSKVEDKDTEILRFDCFDQAPHYHYGPENFNIRLYLDKTTAGNPLSWTLDNIRNNLPADGAPSRVRGTGRRAWKRIRCLRLRWTSWIRQRGELPWRTAAPCCIRCGRWRTAT